MKKKEKPTSKHHVCMASACVVVQIYFISKS